METVQGLQGPLGSADNYYEISLQRKSSLPRQPCGDPPLCTPARPWPPAQVDPTPQTSGRIEIDSLHATFPSGAMWTHRVYNTPTELERQRCCAEARVPGGEVQR